MRNMIVRWNPFEELAAMEQALATNGGRVWRPELDVVESDEAYVVRAALPGLTAEDIHINVENDLLTISAEQAESSEESNERYLLRERRYGSFSRTMRLPKGIDGEQTTAEVKDGVLTLTLPKREEVKPRQIEVKIG